MLELLSPLRSSCHLVSSAPCRNRWMFTRDSIHSQKEYFARPQTVICGCVLQADKKWCFFRWFHKVPVVQSALLDYFAAFLVIVIYTVITFVVMYPLHQGVRDAQEGVSFANVLVCGLQAPD
mgnify:CR=1 FL=1